MTALVLAAILPAAEMRTVNLVADRYDLTPHERHLLCAIRRAENGPRGWEYGVTDRRANTYERQCRFAANTIRLRYTGDLRAFAMRWCPVNWRVWERNVRFFIMKQEQKKEKSK